MRLRAKTHHQNYEQQRLPSTDPVKGGHLRQVARNRSQSQYQQKISDKFQSAKQQLFSTTANLIQKKNFEHLNELAYINNQCDCGRHLSKLSVVKPNLSKYSIYKKHYKKQKRIQNKINISKEYNRFNDGPHLEMHTTYHQGFKGRTGDDIEKPHPKDCLGVDGPSQQLTTYGVQFPGHHGSNQYVKPTDKHAISYHPLRCKTTYNSQYVKPEYKKDQYTYIPDHLKSGSDWFGKTTYQRTFTQPDQDYFAKKVKIVQKLEQNPNYIKQFQTEYKNEYINKNKTVCPAKVFLETSAKNKFQRSKNFLTQNSDFKSFSPEFKAISTSKHYYV